MNYEKKECYFKNGNIECTKYYLNNQLHKNNEPAYIKYYENGKVKCQLYYINNKLHREDGPACIEYYDNGGIVYESYYVNGQHHRVDGPAYISYYKKDNSIICKNYFINDKDITNVYDKYKYDLTKRAISVQKKI